MDERSPARLPLSAQHALRRWLHLEALPLSLPNCLFMPMKRLTALLATLCLLSPANALDSDPVDQEIAAATLVKKGAEAPDFTCTTTDGRKLTLSELRGKVIVMYFFASSAPACFTEMKYLEKAVHQKLHDRQDIAVIGIGRGHTREEVVVLGGKNGLTFPLAADADKAVYNRYFSAFVPRLVVVDKKGHICHLQSGSRDYDGIVELVFVLEKELRKSS
jgi:peroxiredoxin